MINYLKIIKRYSLYFVFKFKTFLTSKKKFFKYQNDLDIFINNLNNKIHFAFSRFSDGEIFMLKNKKISIKENICMVDDKVFGRTNYTKEELKEFDPSIHGFYLNELIKCINHEQDNYFKGIACTCCNGKDDVKFINKFIKNNKNITFSNLIFNGNYEKFYKFLSNFLIDKNVIFIMSKYATPSNLKFKCKKIFFVGENCMVNDFELIQILIDYVKNNNIKNHYFLFSAGSLSNFLIYYLFSLFKDNTYLDVGSFFNPDLKMQGWKVSRGYLQEYWLNKKPKFFLSRKCYW